MTLPHSHLCAVPSPPGGWDLGQSVTTGYSQVSTCAITCTRRHTHELAVITCASQRPGVPAPQQACIGCTHAPTCTRMLSHCHTHTRAQASCTASNLRTTSRILVRGALAVPVSPRAGSEDRLLARSGRRCSGARGAGLGNAD